jgi:WD40 repeat protein
MERSIVAAIFILFLFTPTTSFSGEGERPLELIKAEQEVKEGNYAIVIGVEDYLSDDISDLNYCEDDARAFVQALKAQGWDKDKIKLLLGSDARYENIHRAVNSLVRMERVPENSAIIFFFSGHGVPHQSKNYLVPQDGSADVDYIADRNIELEWVEDVLRGSPFDRKLMFIDACRREFAGEEGEKAVPAGGFHDIGEPKGIKVLLSTEEGRFSYEDDNLRGGVFTHFIVEGLTGVADVDRDGKIVLSELELYVGKQMEDYSFRENKEQRMVSRGECSPMVPLAIVPIPPELPEPSPEHPEETTPEHEPPIVEPGISITPLTPLPVSHIIPPLVGEPRVFKGHKDSVNSVAFSPDGRYVISGSGNVVGTLRDSTIRLWDVNKGKEIHTFSGHSGAVLSVAFSPDGRYVISGSKDKTLKLWDVNTGKEIRTFSGHEGDVASVAFSPDGHYVVSGGGYKDKVVKVWDLNSGWEKITFSDHLDYATVVAFSPGGSFVITGENWGNLKLWDVHTGKQFHRISTNNLEVYSVAFNPDGSYVLSGGDDGTLELWDVNTGEGIRTFSGHSGEVYSVAFSPNRRYVLSGSYDKTLKLWDIDTGGVLTLSGHTSSVNSVAFSPCGRYAISGSSDKTLKLWNLGLE